MQRYGNTLAAQSHRQARMLHEWTHVLQGSTPQLRRPKLLRQPTPLQKRRKRRLLRRRTLPRPMRRQRSRRLRQRLNGQPSFKSISATLHRALARLNQAGDPAGLC